MKKIILYIALVICSLTINAQTFTANFTGAAANIPGTATTQKFFPITITGVGNIDALTKGLASVCMNLTHPNDDELEIVLLAPDGTIVPLTVQNGGTGNNYTNTCFTATATQFIKFGTAPFTGSFLPEGHLGSVNNGQNANGVWNLCIQDRRVAANAGSLSNFSLTFNTTPAPEAPVKPTCAVNLPATSTCANATSVCDFSGLCGTTNGNTVQTWTGSNLNSCFGIENNSFLKFVASATSASFSVWVPTNTIPGNYNLGGIQILFFSGTCNSGPVTTYGCYPHIYPYSASGKPLVSVVTANGLTPGNTYYMMIDGFNGDHCTFTIEALQGVNILDIAPTDPSICAGSSVNLQASGGGGSYTWSPVTGLNTTSGANVIATPASTITYTVTSTGAGFCPLTKNVTVNVNPLPTISVQPSNAAQPLCQNATAASLSVTATAGGTSTIKGYQWYSNTVNSTVGGTLIPGATSATYTPPTSAVGTLYYYCIITNSNDCKLTSNVSGAVVVSPSLVPPTASATVQPTCSNLGTITVTAPLGANLEYNIDGGTFQSGLVFTNLAPGPHNIIVKDKVTGCFSTAATVVLNNVPGSPATPSVTLIQPDCIITTGTITITAPLNPDYQYSIDGTTYQSSNVFNLLAPNSYSVTVKNTVTGCVSTAVVVVINAIPANPIAPVVNITQHPNCISLGAFIVTSPLGSDLEYSLDGGTFQSSTSFTNIASGPHSLVVKNTTTGCVSSAASVVMNAIPAPPPAPTASATVQRTCIVNGTITVTAPVGPDFQYSIDGATYQAGTVFPGLTSNSYSVTVKNIVTGCVSSVAVVVFNPLPTAPATATATVTQPTCVVNSAITITFPLGANYEYSMDGGAFQANPIFNTVSSGTHGIIVKDIVTGCVSVIANFTVNGIPAAPATVTTTVTHPNCTVTTGTITIISPLGANLEYSINGVAYQAGLVFSALASNSYPVTVRNTSTGCVSTIANVVVNAIPASPAVAAIQIVKQPTCIVLTGSINVTNPVGANYEYSMDGGAFQSSPQFNTIAPGLHQIRVRDIVTNCISNNSPFTINAVPAPPNTATFNIVRQPSCANATGDIVILSPLGADLQYSLNGGTYQSSVNFTGLPAGNHTVLVKNTTTDCISLAPATITIVAAPVAPSAPIVVSGASCGPGVVNLSATGAGTINWYSDATLTNVVANGNVYAPTISSTTQYYVTATNNGCTSVPAIVTGTVNPIPTPNLGVDRLICKEDNVVLSPGVFASYVWQNGAITPTLKVSNSGNYSVKVKNAAGCEATANVLITVLDNCDDIYFPTAFTPNGDMVNDKFGPLPNSVLSFVTEYNLIIYNRYGQRVFQSNDPQKKWDGKFLGKMLAGNYAWYASYKYRGTQKTNKGNILVVR